MRSDGPWGLSGAFEGTQNLCKYPMISQIGTFEAAEPLTLCCRILNTAPYTGLVSSITEVYQGECVCGSTMQVLANSSPAFFWFLDHTAMKRHGKESRLGCKTKIGMPCRYSASGYLDLSVTGTAMLGQRERHGVTCVACGVASCEPSSLYLSILGPKNIHAEHRDGSFP